MTDPTSEQQNSTKKTGLHFPKWLWFALAGIVAVSVAVVLLIVSATDPGVQAANKFLDHVGNGRIEQAYKEAAPLFRQRQTLEGFRQVAQRIGIDKFVSASWTSREISGKRIILKGTISLRGGAEIATEVGLLETAGAWRVIGMNFPSAGRAMPKRAQIEALALRSLLDFNNAVRNKNFTAFHAKLSAPMRKKYSVADIQGVFAVFIARNIDIVGIRDLKPKFDSPPRVAADGSLHLKGRYPSRPSEVLFDLRYVKEAGEWRLITINVNLKPAT